MTPDDRDPTHRYDNGEWEPQGIGKYWPGMRAAFHPRGFILAFAILGILTLLSSCAATEYCFAPGSPASFRTMVRKVIAVRAQCEDWTEVPPVQFWQPAPLTFQAVKTAFITPGPLTPYASLPLVEGKIYRHGNVAAWLFRSGAPRDFITINVRNRTKRDVMMQDLNVEIDLWLKGR